MKSVWLKGLGSIESVSLRIVKWEIAAAAIVIVCALATAWPVIHGMATSSLWIDEFYSVQKFASKGPGHVLTHYTVPNNHIFFNLLNSFTLDSDSLYLPWRVRLWSFAFVAFGAVLLLWYFTKAGKVLEGSILVFLMLANVDYLDLILQARGYGLLSLGAIVCCVASSRWFERRDSLTVAVVALSVWLATWAVPTFVLFGGALMALLWVTSKDGRWLVAGTLCLLAIACSYLPVHKELIGNSSTFAKDWGKGFADWNSISSLLSGNLFFGAKSWLVFIGVMGIAGGAVIVSKDLKEMDRGALCLGLAVLATYAIALKLETLLVRTVAFTVIPCGYLAAAVFRRLTFWQNLKSIRVAGMLLVVLGVTFITIQSRKTYKFIPIEAWMETARCIEKHFPQNTKIVAQFRSRQLRAYLSKDYPVSTAFDVTKFLAGKQIVVDSAFKKKDRFDTSVMPNGYEKIAIPQRRGDPQTIYYFPQ
ncbi:MAG TPA: hypothetical protein VIT21_02130 [Chthoniobacterales bacterium]